MGLLWNPLSHASQISEKREMRGLPFLPVLYFRGATGSALFSLAATTCVRSAFSRSNFQAQSSMTSTPAYSLYKPRPCQVNTDEYILRLFTKEHWKNAHRGNTITFTLSQLRDPMSFSNLVQSRNASTIVGFV